MAKDLGKLIERVLGCRNCVEIVELARIEAVNRWLYTFETRRNGSSSRGYAVIEWGEGPRVVELRLS